MSERVQELFNAKIRKAVLAYERGASLKAIAGRVGVSAPTVAKWLAAEGYRRKGTGRIPIAMKARVRDLVARGWSVEAVGGLLGLGAAAVEKLSGPIENPILGGRDPLKIKGQQKRKKDRPAKETKKTKWPPPKHKCRKRWNPVEEAYVIQLIEKKVPPGVIYKKMRASRNRQARIWKKNGNDGRPPNLPPAGEPFVPRGPSGAGAAYKAEEAERVRKFEAEIEEQRKQIADATAEYFENQNKLKILVQKNNELRELQAKAEKQLEITARYTPEERRRVLPGSYEAEQLKLPVGTLVGRRERVERPKSLGQYADNGRYFTVSTDWPELRGATQDELILLADYMTRRKFPARAERHGKFPSAYIDNTWPKKVADKWIEVIDGGMSLLREYSERKKTLSSRNMYSKQIAQYLAAAYDAYRNPKLTREQKASAQNELEDQWARTRRIDRYIMVYAMGVADVDGKPTTRGIDRGLAAKILLERASRAIVRKLTEREGVQAPPRVRKVRKIDIEEEDLRKQLKALAAAGEDEDEGEESEADVESKFAMKSLPEGTYKLRIRR